jgi:hypothetical protein
VVSPPATMPRSKARNSLFEEWIIKLFIRLANTPKACQKFFLVGGGSEGVGAQVY